MRRFVYMTLCLVLAGGTSLSVFAQKKVHHKDNFNQITSMEVGVWNFTPRSDYYNWDYKRVLGIKIPIPGNGWHQNGWCGTGFNLVPNTFAGLAGRPHEILKPSNYVNEPWRAMSAQRIAGVAEMILMKDDIGKSKSKWDDMLLDDILTIADRSGVVSGALSLGSNDITRNDRNAACTVIDQFLGEIKDEETRDVLQREYDRLLQQINAVAGAHIDDARKTLLLTSCNKGLERLADRTKSLNRMQILQEEAEKMMKPARERVQKFMEKNEWAGELFHQFFLAEESPYKIDEEGKQLLESLIDIKNLN